MLVLPCRFSGHSAACGYIHRQRNIEIILKKEKQGGNFHKQHREIMNSPSSGQALAAEAAHSYRSNTGVDRNGQMHMFGSRTFAQIVAITRDCLVA